MGNLDGKTAVVTGGSRGIGRAIVERLTHDGASVVFSFVANESAAKEVAEKTGATAVQADQGRLDDIRRLIDMAGTLDILVVNAAMVMPTPIADVTEDAYDRTMAVNTKGPFFAIKYAADAMRDGGRIVGISTINTVIRPAGVALYAAGKAALEQFVAVAARELGPRGITVNCVSPGATETDLLHATNPPEALDQAVKFTALQRIGQPADIADVVAFLSGPESRWITGQNILATGGMIA